MVILTPFNTVKINLRKSDYVLEQRQIHSFFVIFHISESDITSLELVPTIKPITIQITTREATIPFITRFEGLRQHLELPDLSAMSSLSNVFIFCFPKILK